MCEKVVLLRKGEVEFIGDPHIGITGYLTQSAEEHSAAIDLTTYPRQREHDGGQMLSLRYLNEEGTAAARISWDSNLLVELRYRVERPMKNLDISMAVTHAEGLRVFSEAYSDQRAAFPAEPGEYSVRLSIPIRFFKLESYFFGIGIFDDGRYIDAIDAIPMPEIVNENANINMESHRWGVVRIPVIWDSVQPC